MFQDFLFKYKKLVNKISLTQFFINESMTKKKKKKYFTKRAPYKNENSDNTPSSLFRPILLC